MIFNKKEIPRVPFTVEQCNKCKKEIKRKFKEGDCLFSETVKCPSCDGILAIDKIFGESVEK